MKGICSFPDTPPPLPRATLVGLVGGAIVFSLAFHPAEDSEYTYSGGIPVCPVKSRS